MSKLFVLNFTLIGFMAVAAATAQAQEYRGYEMPGYRVAAQEGAFELRDYEPYLVAEVTVRGDRNGAANRGFRTLAGYIFGGNATEEKIAMTAPVVQRPSSSDTWTVSLMMPRAHSKDSLPGAQTDAIRFETVGSQRMATVQFTGRWTNDALVAKENELRDWISAKGLTPEGEAQYFFYDPPFRLPWNRRNEVAFAVR